MFKDAYFLTPGSYIKSTSAQKEKGKERVERYFVIYHKEFFAKRVECVNSCNLLKIK